MGLTIHYTLSLREDIFAGVVRELVWRTGQFARKIGCAEVGGVLRAEKHEYLATHFFRVTDDFYSFAEPESGWLIQILPGAGCETVKLGLCRYPSKILLHDGLVSTGVEEGWRLQSFCKTQYAGEHGWENFLKCHRVVISLLDFWRGLGAQVHVSDEGDFWETRSVEKLRHRFDSYNGLVAAMSGMLKDSTGGLSLESPIFNYKDFERLEHEGWVEFGGRIEQMAKKIESVRGRN
jgi:hypothetical protein